MNAERRLFGCDAERRGNLLQDCVRRLIRIDRQVAANQLRRIDEAQYDIRIRHGRHRSALIIANRARHCAGAFRPDAKRATRVDLNQAAAAGTNFGDVDRRNTDMIAAAFQKPRPGVDAGTDIELADAIEPAFLDHGRLGRRAPHVKRQDVLEAELAGDLGSTADAGRWA